MRIIVTLILLAFLTGCAAPGSIRAIKEASPMPTIQRSPIPEMLSGVPPVSGRKITVAVYSFSDKTGQRKPSETTST